jgi:hypothetical protein
VENYLTPFARVAFLANQGYADDAIAFVIQRSAVLVAAYRHLRTEFAGQRTAQARLRQIGDRVQPADNPARPGTKGGRQP